MYDSKCIWSTLPLLLRCSVCLLRGSGDDDDNGDNGSGKWHSAALHSESKHSIAEIRDC